MNDKGGIMRITGRLMMGLAAVALLFLGVVLFAAPGQQPSGNIERGKYLVNSIGCGDCHTPMKMGSSGPESDAARLLSGHPETLIMPAPPKLGQGPWLGVVSATFTAWAGPWGTSFTSNLTPDKDTGLGKWSAQTFIDAIQAGRHMGGGRQLLPPMPYAALRNLTDDDLRSIFSYIASIPPISNRVPDPVPPGDGDTR
jgi:mono/diheme cytochrome c family protein